MAYYIEKGCIGCHYCKLECPANAIRFKGAGYWIDQDKCIECGNCVELCRLDLIKSTEPVPSPQEHEDIALSCDVLVIGAGGVGTGAAAKAADLGMDVILIEAAKHYGGGTYFAHGANFPGTKVLAEKLGFKSNVEDTVKFWLSMKKDGVKDVDKLRGNVAANGEFIDWFATLDPSFVEPFVANKPGHPVPMDMPARHINTKSRDDSIGPGWMGSWITDKLFETALKKGVRYFNKTRAKELMTDEDGKVTGVIAYDEGGKIIINARAIILGTGGYMMNDERMKAIDPDMIRGDATYLRLNVPTNVGDGHDMVAALGADVDYTRGGTRGPTHHPYSYAVNRFMGSPEMVFFSDEGDRLFEMSNAPMGGGAPVNGPAGKPSELILRSKTGRCYTILDSELLEKIGSSMPPLDNGEPMNWRGEIEEEVALEDWPARRADSVEELAVKLGMQPERLAAAVERYNGFCENGVDEDFGKEAKFMQPIVKAPFYAFMARNFDNGASRGGISIDHDFRVLKKNGEVIPGVWCSGDAATYSWSEDIGPTGLCGGLGGSWASGYHIAELATEYIKA